MLSGRMLLGYLLRGQRCRVCVPASVSGLGRAAADYLFHEITKFGRDLVVGV